MEEKKLNQILSSNNTVNEKFEPTSISKTPTPKKATFHFFKFQFIFFLMLAVLVTGYYFYLQYDKKQKEALSEEILQRFSITSLYENHEADYSASRVNNENRYETDSLGFSVIGIIEIKAIGINYPIIHEFNDELLKIAPCKFLGPNPNEVGNLCIAGHNYNNYQFFSRLKKLNMGDIIYIYDLTRKQSGIRSIPKL